MDSDVVISLAAQAMELAFKVALPLLLVGLVVGLVVVVFQAVTQIQEQTLAFIPKILATVVVMVVGGPVDARPAPRATRTDLWTVDPGAGRLTRVTAQQLIAAVRRAAGRGLLPRARAHLAAVRARAAVLEQVDPAARARRSSPSRSPSASRRSSSSGQHLPTDAVGPRRPDRARRSLVGAGVRVRARARCSRRSGRRLVPRHARSASRSARSSTRSPATRPPCCPGLLACRR